MYKTQERCDTQEKLVSALETIKQVEILNKNDFLGLNVDAFSSEFTRNLKIKIRGNDFTIEWYKNYSSISSEFMTAMFDSIVLTKPTFPLTSDSKLCLQLVKDGQMTVVI